MANIILYKTKQILERNSLENKLSFDLHNYCTVIIR